MSVWLCIPSARPVEEANEVLLKWRERGYKIALFIDVEKADEEIQKYCHFRGVGSYPGYAQAVNGLVRNVAAFDSTAEWFVAGGDDTLPDPNHTAEEIATQCFNHFYVPDDSKQVDLRGCGTFGVMQPTGDRFAGGSIDRIAGSPWMGREWCERVNRGRGPFYPRFTHMFGDEALKRTAERLGVYWMRPDLIHFHNHFARANEELNSHAVRRQPPPHLVKWNSPEHWEEMKAIFLELEAQNFEPCMPDYDFERPAETMIGEPIQVDLSGS